MEGLFILFCLAVAAYTFRPRRPRTAPPVGARVARVRAPRSTSNAVRPAWPVLVAALVGRDLARLQLTLARSCRALVFAFQQQRVQQSKHKQPAPALLSSPAVEIAPVVVAEFTSTQPAYQPERTAYGVSAPRTEPVAAPVPEPVPAEPTYKLKQARVEALGKLFAAGLSSGDVLAVLDGDTAAIRRALSLEVTAGVLAAAMGGTRADRLREIKAAAEVQA